MNCACSPVVDSQMRAVPSLDPVRMCVPSGDHATPDCGVLLEAGHARCRPCFLRFEACHQRLTERFWMGRNFPGFRPRDLFSEDMDVSLKREEIMR